MDYLGAAPLRSIWIPGESQAMAWEKDAAFSEEHPRHRLTALYSFKQGVSVVS